MFNLVDLILMKDQSLKRDNVEEVLTLATDVIKQALTEGKNIMWSDLCTFTWKQKAKTKKAAQEWTEFPYMAEGPKVRVVPDASIDGLKANGGVARMKRELGENNEHQAETVK